MREREKDKTIKRELEYLKSALTGRTHMKGTELDLHIKAVDDDDKENSQRPKNLNCLVISLVVGNPRLRQFKPVLQRTFHLFY